jgi:PadR family transcriptional regulator PadR
VFSPELKKGSTEMLILSLLEARARHGYEIGKLIEARSGGRLTFALPTLYPTLLRLEDRGLIKGRWVEKAGERERCFYRARRTLARALCGDDALRSHAVRSFELQRNRSRPARGMCVGVLRPRASGHDRRPFGRVAY